MHADIVYNYTKIITVSFEILQVNLGYISLFYPLPNLQRWLMSEEMCGRCLVCAPTSDQCSSTPGADSVTMIWWESSCLAELGLSNSSAYQASFC